MLWNLEILMCSLLLFKSYGSVDSENKKLGAIFLTGCFCVVVCC